jgi:hypothetical protein
MTYTVDESGEMHQVDIDEVVEQHGAALVIRAGGVAARARASPSLTTGSRSAEPPTRVSSSTT